MPYQKKGQLIVKHIKGPLLAAIRSPLTKAHDRSLEMLGLRILTSQLHSLNLQTRVASFCVRLINIGLGLVPSSRNF